MTPLPPAVLIVRVAAAPIGALSMLSGVLLLLPSDASPQDSARGKREHAIVLAALYADILGLGAGLLAAGAITCLNVAFTGHPYTYGLAMSLVWVVAGWVFGCCRGGYTAVRRGTVRPPVKEPVVLAALMYVGVVLIVALALYSGQATRDLQNIFVSSLPFGIIAFSPRLAWWIDDPVPRYKLGSALVGQLC